MHAPRTLTALWVIGDHPLCETIQKAACNALELSDNPPSFYRAPSEAMLSEKEWMPFYVALGLALRDIG
jgi:hypothetical protein